MTYSSIAIQDSGSSHPASWTMNTNTINTAGSSVAVMDLPNAIQAARGGEEWAFSFLANYYRSAAERVAQHILRTEEAAADAVQEALVKVHRAMPRFQDGNFRSWLLRIVTNTCYDHLRRQKRRATVSLDELAEQSSSDLASPFLTDHDNPESLALRSESMRALLTSINNLPPWHRHVVLLVDVHGYDYAEAAEHLDLPLGTVKSRLSRARSALRNQLMQAGIVPQHASVQL